MVGSSCEHFTELTAELEGLCLVSKIFGCFYHFKICLLQEFANLLSFGQICLQWRTELGWIGFLFWYSATGCLQTILLPILWFFPGWITDALRWEHASGNHPVRSSLLPPQLEHRGMLNYRRFLRAVSSLISNIYKDRHFTACSHDWSSST